MPPRCLASHFLLACSLSLVGGVRAGAQGRGVGVEIRGASSFVYRGSRGGEPGSPANESVHFSGRGSLRLFARTGHGVVLERERMLDLDLDGLSDESFHGVELRVTHLGYGYRHFTRVGPKRAFSVTPLVVATAGVADDRDHVLGARHPVYGFRLGVDFGGHFGRLIIGFGYHYALLAHSGGPVRVSHLFVGNLLLLQVGVAMGAPHAAMLPRRRIHEPDDP